MLNNDCIVSTFCDWVACERGPIDHHDDARVGQINGVSSAFAGCAVGCFMNERGEGTSSDLMNENTK